MSKFLKQIISLIVIFTLVLSASVLSASANTVPKLKILFIGNSLTFYYNMPQKLQEEADNSGKSIQIDCITKSDASVAQFAFEPGVCENVYDTINKKYDYVVLQPTRKISPADYNYSKYIDNANTVYLAELNACKVLNKAICATGAKTLLYSPMPLSDYYEFPIYVMKSNSKYACNPLTNSLGEQICFSISSEEHAALTKNICNSIATQMKDTAVVNCTDACQYSKLKRPDLNLYNKDNRHPNTLGAFLASYCFYSYLFKSSPVGINTHEDVNKTNMVFLQRVASISLLGEKGSIIDEENTVSKITDISYVNETKVSLKFKCDNKRLIGFYIYRKASNENNYSKIAIAYKNSYTDYSVLSGKLYYYKVRAIYKIGDVEFTPSVWSAAATVSTLDAPKALPVELINRYTTKISIQKSENANEYVIYRKISGGEWTKIATTSKTYFSNKNLKSGKIYYYKVKAKNTRENTSFTSDFSNSVGVATIAQPKFYLNRTKSGNLKIKIKSVSGANAYFVRIKNLSSGRITYKRVTKTSFVIKNLKKGKKYSVKIRADKKTTNKIFYGNYSNYKYIRIKKA